MTSEEDERKDAAPTSPRADLDSKDYVALIIAMAETTILPLVLLVIVLAGVGLILSMFLFR